MRSVVSVHVWIFASLFSPFSSIFNRGIMYSYPTPCYNMYCACSGCEIGEFIPKHAPHFGGLCEVRIKSFKGHLRWLVSNVKLTFEELTTVFTHNYRSMPQQSLSCSSASRWRDWSTDTRSFPSRKTFGGTPKSIMFLSFHLHSHPLASMSGTCTSPLETMVRWIVVQSQTLLEMALPLK